MSSIDKKALKEFVENNPKLVTRRESINYPGLYVLKYAKRVFYDNLWNESEFLKLCRGLVVDADYNVVVQPLVKVFNYGENNTKFGRDEVCRIVRKVNGFMACATYNPEYSDDVIVSTTGSLDSKFVDLASVWIDPMEDAIKNTTFKQTMVFEVCDPTDRHIIDEHYGIYLLACYVPDVGWMDEKSLDFMAEQLGCKRPEWDEGLLFDEVVQISKHVKHEGFMVYNEAGECLKIKSPHYLTTKLFARMNGDKVLKLLENPKEAKKKVDEEYYDLIDYLSSFRDEFVAMDEQEKIAFIKDFIEADKDE